MGRSLKETPSAITPEVIFYDDAEGLDASALGASRARTNTVGMNEGRPRTMERRDEGKTDICLQSSFHGGIHACANLRHLRFVCLVRPEQDAWLASLPAPPSLFAIRSSIFTLSGTFPISLPASPCLIVSLPRRLLPFAIRYSKFAIHRCHTVTFE